MEFMDKTLNLTAFELDHSWNVKIYTMAMPERLLTYLNQINQKVGFKSYGYGNLYLNGLKEMLLRYVPGIVFMDKVNNQRGNNRWQISSDEIPVEMLVRILQVWIETAYAKKRDLAKELLSSLQSELSAEWFDGCQNCEEVEVIYDNGQINPDMYSLLPYLCALKLVGKEWAVDGKKYRWLLSAKDEVMTEPIPVAVKKKNDAGKMEKIEEALPDCFSYVISFRVDTLPETNKPFLNIQLSMRRWISKNLSKEDPKELPYLPENMSVYIRVAPEKVAQITGGYFGKHDFTESDKAILKSLYGIYDKFDFATMLRNPDKYLTNSTNEGGYLTYQNGIKIAGKDASSLDAGLQHHDRACLFGFVRENLSDMAGAQMIVERVSGNKTIFNDALNHSIELTEDEDVRNDFLEQFAKVSPHYEILYSGYHKETADLIYGTLKSFSEKYKVDLPVDMIRCDDLLADLPGSYKNKPDKKEVKRRISDIADRLKNKNDNRMSIVVLGSDFYPNKSKDPKATIRAGLARTGRLSQFIIHKKEREDDVKAAEKEINRVYSAILDSFRSLGIQNQFTKKFRDNHQGQIFAGMYMLEGDRLLSNEDASIPVIVTLDPCTNEYSVYSKFTSGDAKVTIHCPYNKFPLELQDHLSYLNNNDEIESYTYFLSEWLADIGTNKHITLMLPAEVSLRNYVTGIQNKNIASNNDPNMLLVDKNETAIDLSNYSIDVIRLRSNYEIPDYYPNINDKDTKYEDISGIFKGEEAYYSLCVKPKSEQIIFEKNKFRTDSKKLFTHRNLVEIYPIYLEDPSKYLEVLQLVHNMRSGSIQTINKITYPLPVHMAQCLKEYLL